MNNQEKSIGEDGTLDVAFSPEHQLKISNEEWFEISLALEPHHAVFYKVWQMGKPIFNDQIETAGVQFDENGDFIWFHFNPHFWKRLQFKDKLFVICHEALHIILNHGLRTRDCGRSNREAVNVALDLVINHSLVTGFGFDRDNIDSWQDYCWIDTVFPDKNPKPPTNEMYEYYLNLFDKVYGDGGMGDGENGSGSGGNPGLVDDHNMMGKQSDKWDKVIDQLNEGLSPEEKESLKSTINKHFQKETKPTANPNQEAGGGTGQWVFTNIGHVKKKQKWETVIKKWSKKYLIHKDKEVEQWSRVQRRMSMLSRDMFLPTDMEIEYDDKEKTRIKVYFFLDTSGSCWGLKDRFFAAAASLSPEKFDVRLLCFDTKVVETTLESKKIYGGGGTSFSILEDFVQKEMNLNDEKYPEAVWVLTDGYGNKINPQFPNNWYWFLTNGGVKNYINNNCNFLKLEDYE